MRYIPLGTDKTPLVKLSDGGLTFAQVRDFENVAVLVPEPFVVFDFDYPGEAAALEKLIERENVGCLAMRTTRGLHLWFQSEKPLKNSIKTRSALGLTYDVRSYGKLSYVMVKKDGVWREWVRQMKADQVENVPAWLTPVPQQDLTFLGMRDGDGRNQTLYEYILTLQKKGLTKDQIRQTLSLINKYLFHEPLTQSEMETITRDDSFAPETQMSLVECFDEKGRLSHDKFAELIMANMRIVTTNYLSYVYDGTYYKPADRTIDQKMIELYSGITRYQRLETRDYIQIMTHTPKAELAAHEYALTLENGVLDLKTKRLAPFNPDFVDFVKVPVTFDPKAYNQDLDLTLNRVFHEDPQSRLTFEEIIGYCLIKNCRYRKGFIFLGEGSNGKSTLLNMLKVFFGEANIATIELDKLNDRFKTAELENKLVNIGDDINYRKIDDTGTLKKLFTGDSFTVERKNQHPFQLRSHAKLIFSANQMPKLSDTTLGIYSRLILLPFDHEFSAEDPDFDPHIEDKLTSPEALSYLLNLALAGLERLTRRNQFTISERSALKLEAYRIGQSYPLAWAAEEDIDVAYLTEAKTTEELYSEYQDWHVRSGLQYPVSLRTFHSEMEKRFGLIRKRVKNITTGGKYRYRFYLEEK